MFSNLLILFCFYCLFCYSDKRDDKRNGSSSKSRKKSPDREKDRERSKSKEKTIKSESSEYNPGTVDKVILLASNFTRVLLDSNI